MRNLIVIICICLLPGCKISETLFSNQSRLVKLSLIINGVNYNAAIDETTKVASIALPWNTALNKIKTDVKVLNCASYNLSDSVDYTKNQTITITAANKTSSTYKLVVYNSQTLNLTNEKIEVLNCLHVLRDTTKIKMSRFNELNLAEPKVNYLKNGQTQTSVIIRFRTNSNYVRMHFKETAGAHWGNNYGVWVDGVWFNHFTTHTFILQKPLGEGFVTWEVTPSLMNAVDLIGIEIENGKELISTILPVKPQYFAIGNSITQGIGQGNAGYLSYPFLFGKKMGYETYNLGVGGSKVNWKVATELENRKADLISVLWGYNDWYFVGETVANYRSSMLALINKIREYQPNTALVCISLIGTENPTPFSGVKVEEYREVVRQLVSERISAGDKNLYYLDGATINVELMDKVHPSIKGAADLAQLLESFVKKTIEKNER